MNLLLEHVHIYVDGSVNKINAPWAFLVVEEESQRPFYSKCGALTGEILEMRQVGAEMKAVIESIQWCKQNNCQASVFFDLINLKAWIADLFGEAPWQAKNKWSQSYRRFCLENQRYICDFIKVKSHSGDRFNEMVDKIAKNYNKRHKIA